MDIFIIGPQTSARADVKTGTVVYRAELKTSKLGHSLGSIEKICVVLYKSCLWFKPVVSIRQFLFCFVSFSYNGVCFLRFIFNRSLARFILLLNTIVRLAVGNLNRSLPESLFPCYQPSEDLLLRSWIFYECIFA